MCARRQHSPLLSLLLLSSWSPQGSSFLSQTLHFHRRSLLLPHAVPLVDYAQKLCVPSSLFGPPAAAAGGNATTTSDALLPAVLHESDVNRLSVLLCDCLGSGEVFLPEDGGDYSEAEQVLLRAVLGAWNLFARAANRYETALGIRVRCKDRLKFDDTTRRGGGGGGGGGPPRSGACSQESEGAAAAEGEPAAMATTTTTMMTMMMEGADGLLDGAYEPDFGLRGRRSLVLVMEDDAGEFVASAELALQPRDGQLPTNFPSLFGDGDGDEDSDADGAEEEEEEAAAAAEEGGRMNADGQPALYYPYICNVAVAAEWRRRGLAMHLVRLCEQLAARQWGFNEVYLHVDPANEAATCLYRRTGYEPVPPEKRGPAARLFGGLLELMEPDVTYMYKKI